MIVFYDETGIITGYQTFPNHYSGQDSYITVDGATDIANKKVVNGQLVDLSQPEIDQVVEESLLQQRQLMVVTRRQAIRALYDAGLLETVEAAIASVGGTVKIDYENAIDFKRLDSTILQMQSVLGWTDEQLDDLFVLAKSIPQ